MVKKEASDRLGNGFCGRDPFISLGRLPYPDQIPEEIEPMIFFGRQELHWWS